MSVKILGADLIAYWRAWPLGDDYYLDESPLGETDAGVLALDEEDGLGSPIEPHKKYSINGLLVWQGRGSPPQGRRELSLASELKKWLKLRRESSKVITVDVPLAQLEEIVKLLEGRGLKVVVP